MNTDCVILTALPAELESVKHQFRRFRPIAGAKAATHRWYETTAPNGLKVVAGAPANMGKLTAASL